MRKSTMDKVFDVLAEENRRFARLQEAAERARPSGEKPRFDDARDLVEAKRRLDRERDFKMTLCA